MNRSELIDLIVVRTSGTMEQQQKLRQALSEYSTEELDRYVRLEVADEELLQIQAERAARLALYKHLQQQAQEPQRRAEAQEQEKQDRETFRQACRQYNISNVEANFSLIRHTLGPNFNSYQVGQAATSGAVSVAPATVQEQEQWRQEAIEAHNLRLLGADLPTLRKLAREAGARGSVAPPPDETQRVRAAERVDGFTYPPLPEEFRDGNSPEQVLDASFIKRCSRETYRLLFDRYGSAQITDALRTRVPGNSW